MGLIPDLAQAQEILQKYNKEDFHLRHARIVSGVMGYFAREYAPDEVNSGR